MARSHDIDDLVALLRRDRLVGDQEAGIGARSQQPKVTEHAGSQDELRVRHQGAAADGSRIGVQRVVDEVHLAPDHIGGLILQPDLHGIGVVARLRPISRLGLPLVLQIERLGAVESEANGVEVGDVGQDGGVLGHKIADRDPPIGDAATQGGDDPGELQVQGRGLHIALGRGQIRRRLLFGGEPGLVLLLRDRLGRQQVLRPCEFDLGVVQRRLGVLLLPSRLGQGRLIGPRIDDEEQLALAHDLTVTKVDRGQIARDARPDVDRVDRFEPADVVVPIDDLGLKRFGHRHDRRRRWRRLLLLATDELDGEDQHHQ